MKLLVDSHVLLWAVEEPLNLSSSASAALQDTANDLLLSAASVWEIAIKNGLGKLKLALPYRLWMTQVIADLQLTLLPITVDYANVQASLPYHHRDPFDRLIIAQALQENAFVVGADPDFDAYGVIRIW